MSSNGCAECVVTEYCPECETEVTMHWDVRALGYKAFCPHCGKRLMLCSECQFIDDCDYDSETDSCRFNARRNNVGKKYRLTLTEKQLRVINAALEEYFRAAFNQWDVLANRMAFRGFNSKHHTGTEFDRRIVKRNAARHTLDAAGAILLSGSDCAGNRDLTKTEDEKIASDMWRILRWELQPESLKREIYRDTYHESNEPPIKVEAVSE